MTNRDTSIDILRSLGLLLIILVHIHPPFILSQIRCFDVPLMLFVSGLTASGKQIHNYLEYIKKCTLRLVLPVWIFLAFYLSAFYFAQDYILPTRYLTGKMVLRSFLLLDESIGYVWIIRVFLLTMLITPLLQRISNQLKTPIRLCSYIVITFATIEFLYSFVYGHNSFLDVVIKDYLIYTLGYSVPYVIGLKMRYLAKSVIGSYLLYLLILTLCFFVLYITVHGMPINISPSYKEPPRHFFLMYGCFVSVLLWTLKNHIVNIAGSKVGYMLSFIGQNTIWIYLWHMPFVLLINATSLNWEIKYITVFSISIVIYSLQYILVKKSNNPFLNRYLIG